MPPKKHSAPTPTTRAKTDEDENEVYWDQAVHPRRRSTPLKPKPKRDSAAAEMPSPSKTVIDHEPSASPDHFGPRAPHLVRSDTSERRSLRLNKRLKDRQPSSAENEPAATTTAASTAVRDIPGIDVLLNRLKEKEGGPSKGKAKANVSSSYFKHLATLSCLLTAPLCAVV